MDSGYPQDISRWGGVPRNIDAVLTSVFDGLTYFFQGDKFWTFDDYSLSTAPDSPRRINGFWTFTSCSDNWDANLKKIRWYLRVHYMQLLHDALSISLFHLPFRPFNFFSVSFRFRIKIVVKNMAGMDTSKEWMKKSKHCIKCCHITLYENVELYEKIDKNKTKNGTFNDFSWPFETTDFQVSHPCMAQWHIFLVRKRIQLINNH